MRPLVLLTGSHIEGDRNIQTCLERGDYRVQHCITTDVVTEIQQVRPAAVLVDVQLRDRKGLELCSALRRDLAARDLKIFLITELTADCILGFNAGADDCLTRPVVPADVLMRLDAMLRPERVSHLNAPTLDDTILMLGDVELNLLAMRVSVAGDAIPTTLLEFRLLEYMARNPGKVFTRDELLDAVWGVDCFVTPRSVDACVRRIRNKIEDGGRRPSFLKTIRGVGYCLENSGLQIADNRNQAASLARVS